MDIDVQSYPIGHLGIVAGIFDSLNIAEVIDTALPKKSSRNLPRSVVIKAMILNGLGFTGQRLYLFPNFFMTIPTEKLLGEGITPSDLNDDVVGRCQRRSKSVQLWRNKTVHLLIPELKLRGCADAGHGGVLRVARFIQPRLEHK